MDRGGRSGPIGTSEAREHLPALVSELIEAAPVTDDPREHEVLIQPRGKTGSASLVPTADLDASEKAKQALREENEQLREDLENAGLALFLQERLGKPGGDDLTAPEFLRGIGMGEFVDQLGSD